MVPFIKNRLKRRNRDSFIKKKLNKKIRQRPRSDMLFRASKKIQKKILLICIISGSIALVVVGIIARNSFFYGSKNTITQINFGSWTIAWYSNELLIDTITNDLVWTSRRANKRFGITTPTQSRSNQFNLVQWVTLESFEEGTATIQIVWNTPSLLFRLPWNRWYWSYNENIFEIAPQDWITSSTRIIDLPRYTETFDTIDGIFWSYSESQLVEVLETIDTELWVENISEYIYLPWGKKLFLWYDSKRRYIHLNKDITIQLEKISAVRDFYAEYQNISIIDVWSTDNVIVK
jgi:hypothetical protein